MTEINRHITLVEGLTSDGQAFITINERLIRVPGFLPGDKIEIILDNHGKIISAIMLDPSPDRVKPDCYFHGPCGGCDLLELSERARKKEKQAMIKRALAKIQNSEQTILKPFSPAKELIRYRPRMRLHQSRNQENRESGYLAAESYVGKLPGGIVPVTSCAIITGQLNKRLVATRKILNQIPIFLECLTLMSSSASNSDKVVGHATLRKGKTPAFFHKDLMKIMRAAQLKGLTVSGPDGKVKEAHGSVSVTGLIAPNTEGGPYEAEPSFFVQSNIFQNEVLINKVINYCQPAPSKRIVEGFAGAGNFSLPLAAQGAIVEAVESHPGAVRTGLKNIHNSGFSERIKLIEGDAMKELAGFQPEPDVLLLDPPRTGTPCIAKIVKSLQPHKVVYVFCDLDAMIRDSNSLIKAGYKLSEVSGIDLYPRTHHVETVCSFDKI
ncbi:MAG: 23S rRNA (uracil(1939)-C(5))-methyltransferase RlmD [Candidatus Rifleibacteriota bacterium]